MNSLLSPSLPLRTRPPLIESRPLYFPSVESPANGHSVHARSISHSQLTFHLDRIRQLGIGQGRMYRSRRGKKNSSSLDTKKRLRSIFPGRVSQERCTSWSDTIPGSIFNCAVLMPIGALPATCQHISSFTRKKERSCLSRHVDKKLPVARIRPRSSERLST